MNTLAGCNLIVQKGPQSGQQFNLGQSIAIVGRDDAADVTIKEQIVSRQHFRIMASGGQFILEDLNSSNGTFVNGVQVFGKTTLKSGDAISIAQDIIFEFRNPLSMAGATQMADIVPPPASGVAQPKLTVIIAGQSPVTYPLTKTQITIGRADDNDIPIQSQVLSRYHVRLERQGAEYIFVPLPNATNPFWFQGAQVTSRMPLGHLNELKINSNQPNTAVTLFYEAAVPSPAPAAAGQPQAEPPAQHSPSGTMLDFEFEPGISGNATPPELIVTIAGQPAQNHRLDKPRLTVGRALENDIVIPSEIVSRYHGHLDFNNGRYDFVSDPRATNALLFEGRSFDRHQLHHNEVLRINSTLPGQMVTLAYNAPSDSVATVDFKTIGFAQKNMLTFGRDSNNDVVLDVPNVSQYHAQIEKVGQRYRVRDLNSSNGTFVNDELVEGEVWVTRGESIRVGPYRFVVQQDEFSQFDESTGLKVDAFGLNKWVRKDLNILKNISLAFKPREFVVVVGQSGGGKSTLVDAIAGYRPATHGRVTVNGIDVYKNFDAIRNEIGFVPQKDIIHMELTVYQALDYAAQLRMPKDTSKSERERRINEVLDDLDLAHRKDVQISGLSGGQQKRVSIGVELLTKPGLFFLDEPTSGLDPGTETSFMHLMRRLADQGRTIILVTHATKNVMLADKVVFLSRGGYLSWFGPPDEALNYFDTFRSEREQHTTPMEFDQIYAILDDSNRGSPEEWAKRYQAHPAFMDHIVTPLQMGRQQPPPPPPGAVQQQGPRQTQSKSKVSALRQFLILSARNIKILTRDRSSLILMLIAAPLVAMLDMIIAPLMGADPFNVQDGNASNAAITLFLMTIYCLLVAGLSQMREFVKEADIYKRERLVNLKILPYVGSKVWVALLLAFYHAAAYAIVHQIAFEMPGGTMEFGLVYFTLVLAAMAGMMSGLLASALAPAASSAPMIMILLIIPQIVLSGALAPVPSYASAPASTRWAFEGFIGITGIGSDIARDSCWQLEEEVRDAMTLDDKAAYGCNCMGVAVFDPNSCNFPGLGEYYLPEVHEPAPPEPPPLRAKPADPEIPPKPEAPADQSDQIAMTQYMNTIQTYQDQVTLIQDEYKNQMSLYEAEGEVYQAKMEAYQEDYTDWNVARTSAVGGAEGLIESITNEFGWAWVDKNDAVGFWSWMISAWVAQGIIITIFIGFVVILIKRKDVN
jgi:ABC transport system ATP-binding/permease protein